MVERTQQVLQQLRELVSTAKSVPMSASCMVNRTEAITLIDQAAQALIDDTQEAQRVAATSLETLERAQEEAKQIIEAAEEKARFLAGQSEVVEEAKRKAAQLETKALNDAEALRREADAYVDARIASFEAGLHKTMSQVRTMRERLSQRSALDDTNTQALPRLRD
jgi:cell division septum initiation protein DivIVA